MANNKSPGIGGLTVEFYKFFWVDIKFFFESINYALSKGTLSVDQMTGLLSLMPKKAVDLIYLKNWRPLLCSIQIARY